MGFSIGDRVYHRGNHLFGTVASEEFDSFGTKSVTVYPEEASRDSIYYRPVSKTETWYVHLLELAPRAAAAPPVPSKDAYPHRHDVCGSPAFISFMSIDCTKCGKKGM